MFILARDAGNKEGRAGNVGSEQQQQDGKGDRVLLATDGGSVDAARHHLQSTCRPPSSSWDPRDDATLAVHGAALTASRPPHPTPPHPKLRCRRKRGF
ncbi:hypothetical protein BHM03_00001736 [Ensete ventricosum]|nr:hypothetical protein BHM03_00001736 [Ensete ventricosum]